MDLWVNRLITCLSRVVFSSASVMEFTMLVSTVIPSFLRLYNTTIPYRFQLRFHAFSPYFMGFTALRIPQRLRLKRLALGDSSTLSPFSQTQRRILSIKKCPATDFSTTGQYLSHLHADSRLKPDFKAILFHNNLVNKPLKQFVVIFRQWTPLQNLVGHAVEGFDVGT